MLGLKHWPGELVFIGVSYFIFQAISYLADVYLRQQKPEPRFGTLLAYQSFFPRLTQGPIERAGNLIPQLQDLKPLDREAIREGCLRFAWGLFKKVVIADRCALYVSAVFDNLPAQSGVTVLFGVYAFAIQLYFDFSGYTDMALGSARLFGVRLTQNFNAPYLATSTADFWRRWHISFSTWIKDYLFEPLQHSLRRWGYLANPLTFMLVFPLIGLWHGTTFGFLVWGWLQALYMSVGLAIKPWQKQFYRLSGLENSLLQRMWRVAITFHLTCFSLMFYRLDTPEKAKLALSKLWGAWPSVGDWALPGPGTLDLLILVAGVALAMLVHGLKERYKLLAMPVWVRWPSYYILALAILLGGKFFEARSFIYAQF
jgi:D-alanyl-lipoteichoic acid acyltransferase DltB (MBOAT superfamily)